MEATTASLVHRGWKRMAPAITAAGVVLVLVSTLCASSLHAQKPNPMAPAPQTFQPAPSAAPQPAPSLLQQPAHEAQIDLGSDTLTIRADNSSLTAILHQIAAKSGMQIDGLSADERVFGNFGPGAPRDVIADLLNGTAYNLVLLGDLSNGVPRQLTLTPATRSGTAATPAPAAQANADDAANDEPVEPPQPEVQQPATPPAPGTPGVRTPQQLFEQLQRMRSQQQQTNSPQDPQQQQQQQSPPQQQP
jgi:hypothetical protein